MTEQPPAPVERPRGELSDALAAFYPYLPYTVVIAAVVAGCLHAPEDVWKPLLLAGAFLVNPRPHEGGAS